MKASLWLMYFVVNLVQTVRVYSETFEGSGTQSAKSHQMWNIWRMKIKVNSLQLSIVEFPSKWMKCSTASWITEQFYCIVIHKRIPFGKHCLPFQQLKTMSIQSLHNKVVWRMTLLKQCQTLFSKVALAWGSKRKRQDQECKEEVARLYLLAGI